MEAKMSDPKRSPVKQLDSLVDAYLKDLLETPDDVFEDDAAHADPQSSAFREVVETAMVEAGKRRLLRARQQIERRAHVVGPDQLVDLAEARRYLAEAANDNRITLAARELQEIPDEEVLRIYRQLQQLKTQTGTGKNHEDV
jgi:hypothetical protein